MLKILEVSTGQCTTRGVKENNEDFCGVLIPENSLLATKGVVAVVADGMSTCYDGREASQLCGRGFLNDYFSTPETWSVKQSAEKVLASLNSWLCSSGHGKGIAGLVTTLSTLILKSTTAHIFHVGDSRIYRIRDSQIEQVTRDHRISVSENSYLNRAIGIDLRLDIDYRTLPLQIDDIFILSTDGVHDFLCDNEIQELVNQNANDLEGAAEQIVSAALCVKSSDNLTCEIVKINSLPSQEAKEVIDHLTELPFPPELSVGMMIDGFRVLSEINLSSRSQIYLCIDNNSSNKVVLKTPSVNFEDDFEYIERFLLEEWVGQRINSPAVLKIYDRDKKKRFLYIVAEYLEGQTLASWIENNPDPDINDVLKITDDIVKGLQVFHRLEIIHQDLKPDNIIVDNSKNIKIIDFGSVRIAGIAEISTPFKRERLLGTKHYTAPEYLFGEIGSIKSDIFSLGVIVYEMLTGGKHPYGEELVKLSNQQSLSKLEYIPTYHYNPMVPVWMDGAIKKAVMPDSVGRYELLSKFIYDLKNPNPIFAQNKALPLIKKNPLLFWKCIALLQLIIIIILLCLVSN